MDGFINFCVEKLLMPAALVLALLVLFVGVPVLIYGGYQIATSPTIALRKDSWVCTDSKLRTTTTYVMSGKVMVPITTTNRHCTQWSER